MDKISYVPESPYAKADRDIAVVVDKTVLCGDIIDTIEAVDSCIAGVTLFDIFESEKIGTDKKSMAFKIELASPEKDITGEMTDEVIDKVVTVLGEKYGAQLRV